MKIVHEKYGEVTGQFHQLRSELERAESRNLEALVREGVILTDEGDLMPQSVQKRMRGRLLGTFGERTTALDEHRRRADDGFVRSRRERRMLIPRLWTWGHIPMFGGNPKAGKTTAALDLTRSIVVPGYRF